MTTPAQLSSWPTVGHSKMGPRGAGALGEATLTRSFPPPPAPVLPLAPPVQGEVTSRAFRRLNGVVRLVAAAAVTLVVVGGLGWIGQAPGSGVPAQTVVSWVGAGETVWDVARRVAPKSDQRAVVERIRQLNGMAGSALMPGQQLQVPDGR
ncbi:MAG TPA: LysM peptidoglycan-binding domain-containing protein [Pseudonocardiaceae bacterium]|nr:LysM peptidoglycan-binding domain-containing protein [Pseudonocardiaceae bacterium]